MQHRRWLRLAPLCVVGLLLVLVAPVIPASEEDARQETQPAKTEATAAKPAAAPASDADAKKKAEAEKKKQAKCDPTFNTIEDLHVLSGPVDALWAAAAEPATAVAWSPIGAEPASPPATR